MKACICEQCRKDESQKLYRCDVDGRRFCRHEGKAGGPVLGNVCGPCRQRREDAGRRAKAVR